MVTGRVNPVTIEETMRSSYLDYAMSVIVSRALPDVRDGLKPVHRRILFAMSEMGITWASSYKKSARIVGEVLGKYHPHGDMPVYDAMVRMAQDFSMRYPLIDGQGNFGSIDDDPPAAMRYTEARLARISEQMLLDIDKDTVEFAPNFDDSLKEPLVLPARLPNLLINGSAGIAVGMATNIPPHNLGEICDALTFMIDNPEVTVDQLCEIVKGPDFPTGGVILGEEGIKSAYATGKGRIIVRAKAYIDTSRRQIIVNEVPFQVNKAALVEKIADLVNDKKITGISDLRDESDRQGLRVVIELKRDAMPEMVLNNLYKYTTMQSTFAVNMLALVDGQPVVLSLKEALQHFIEFRQEVIKRRSKFELKGAKERAHILEGLRIALDNIDQVIKIIRESQSTDNARQNLMQTFSLSRAQADAILEMPLRRLAALERKKILDELAEILKTISYLEDLLSHPARILAVARQEIIDLKDKYADERRTEINKEGPRDFKEEDLIPHQEMAVTITTRGFIKRVPSKVFRTQHRGGKGIIGMTTREEDAVRLLAVADTHDYLLLCSNRGRIFSIKCYEVPPDTSRVGKGMAVVNFFSIPPEEKITDMVVVKEFVPDTFLLMVTRKGEIKKTSLDHFVNVRSSGLICYDVEKDDDLVAARTATEQDDVVLVTKAGQSIRFGVDTIRTSHRTSGGVRGIKLADSDEVVGMGIALPKTFVLVVSSSGLGKLTAIEEYPKQQRAGSGVRTIKLVEKSPELIDAKVVIPKDEVIMVSDKGQVTKTLVKEIRVLSRATQGVILMRLDQGDRVAGFAVIAPE
ncbi:MAG TPA: DNA gyrase subunit A [Dehalococcoidales bacterium]|nr:DNA gyrase subunit A [Dehalococcoidales bacterium]